jgi:hypothetical protein
MKHSAKRAQATDAEIEACKRAFWEETAWRALRRAAARVRDGKPIDLRDREFVAVRLEDLSEQEWQKIKQTPTSQLQAHVAEYLNEKLRIPLEQAAAKAAGEFKPDSIRKAVDRLRENRRKRMRKGQASR